MKPGCLDDMIAFAAAELATGDAARINRLVRDMAQKWEAQSALSICFAMTSAAAILEDQFQGQGAAAQRAYRLASLLAADIFALEQMGQVPTKGHHLLHFWRRVDPYFLDI